MVVRWRLTAVWCAAGPAGIFNVQRHNYYTSHRSPKTHRTRRPRLLHSAVKRGNGIFTAETRGRKIGKLQTELVRLSIFRDHRRDGVSDSSDRTYTIIFFIRWRVSRGLHLRRRRRQWQLSHDPCRRWWLFSNWNRNALRSGAYAFVVLIWRRAPDRRTPRYSYKCTGRCLNRISRDINSFHRPAAGITYHHANHVKYEISSAVRWL